MDDPSRHLVEPAPAEGTISEGYVNPFELLDLASPTAWLNEAIKALTDYDVLRSIVQPVAGDWEGFSRFSGALRNLSYCVQDIGVNIQSHLDILDAAWDGKAGDAAYIYFNGLAANVSAMQFVLREAADNYAKTATGVWQFATQLANILQSIVDEAIIIVVCASVGSALIETGVGAVVGWGLAAWRIERLWRLFNDAAVLTQSIGTAIMLFAGLIQEVNWRFGDLNTTPIPGAAYAHPAVM